MTFLLVLSWVPFGEVLNSEDGITTVSSRYHPNCWVGRDCYLQGKAKDLRFEHGGRQTCFLPRAPSNLVTSLPQTIRATRKGAQKPGTNETELKFSTFCSYRVTVDRQTFLFNIWKSQMSGGGDWPQGLRVTLLRKCTLRVCKWKKLSIYTNGRVVYGQENSSGKSLNNTYIWKVNHSTCQQQQQKTVPAEKMRGCLRLFIIVEA